MPRNIRFLMDVVRQEKPLFIFLCETIAKQSRMEWVQLKLGYQGMFVVEPFGRSGGLAMLWKEEEQAALLGFSQNHIDVQVNMENGVQWHLTGLYGEPNRSLRRRTWYLLRNLARDFNLPLCVIGDVNNVVDVSDKIEGSQYPSSLIKGFNEALMDAGLTDMELVGHQFTWERGRDTDAWMEVRLDRALVSLSWLNMFPMAKLYNLEGTSSDHSPILLVPQVINRIQAHFRFKFENAWILEPMYEVIVKEVLDSDKDATISQKIKICGQSLASWGKEITGNFSGRIKQCKVVMKQYRGGRDDSSKGKYREARKEMMKVLDQRDIFWRQRAKQLWLSAGDQNSKYFHNYASTRRRNNQITKLINDEGNWVEWETGLTALISEYFSKLFTANEVDWQEVIDNIPTTVTISQNEELMQPIME